MPRLNISRKTRMLIVAFGLILSGMALFVVFAVSVVARGQIEDRDFAVATYVYSVNIVCTPELGEAPPVLAQGQYSTAIDVYNPWDESASVTKQLTLSLPQSQSPVQGQPVSGVVGPSEAFNIDCTQMMQDFGLPADTKAPGGKGFLVITSDRTLDVVAVYTAAQASEIGRTQAVSMEVEYISHRQIDIFPAPTTEVSVNLEAPGGSGEYQFDPSEFTFSPGETVTFNLTSETEFHTFTVDELGIDAQVDADDTQTLTYTFDQPGTYQLYCLPHESLGMVGTITVQ